MSLPLQQTQWSPASGLGCLSLQVTSGKNFQLPFSLILSWNTCWDLRLTRMGSLRGMSLCEGTNSSLEAWWWRLKLCSQTGQPEGVKHGSPSRLRNPNTTTMSPPAQGWTCPGAAAEDIYSFCVCCISSLSLLIRHFPHYYSNPWACLPMGTYLHWMELFPVDYLFPRDQVRIQAHAMFITLPWTYLASRTLRLKFLRPWVIFFPQI